MPQRTDEQWRAILALSEAAADLPSDARLDFLRSATTSPDMLAEVLSLVDEFQPDHESAPDRVGTTIGRFTITGYLGSGGVGDVYSARDLELERTVALKFLKPAAVQQIGAGDRFIREAKTASALNHPNIVTVYEILRSQPTLVIVMEWVDGQPLRRFCGKPVPVDQVMQMGRNVALALAAAHATGIVHRDIKPENAIVRSDGSLKVLDFGLATWCTGPSETGDTLSTSHLFAGTWRYMSPEQSRGESVMAATDVFSLGLVLYELGHGRLPPCAESDKRRTTLGYDRTWPVPLRRLVSSMLAESASERPDAAYVAQQLLVIGQPGSSSTSRLWQLATPVLFTGLLIISGILLFQHYSAPVASRSRASSPPVPIAVEPGEKVAPAFSPDGRWIAYSWQKPGRPAQIYLQSIDSANGSASSPQPLFPSEEKEVYPVWSPDGNSIAFIQEQSPQASRVIVFNLARRSFRILADLYGQLFEWMPDGKWLLASSRSSAIVLIPAGAQGSQRTLIPQIKNIGDLYANFSSNRKLAFVRFFGDGISHLGELQLNEDYLPVGKPVFYRWPHLESSILANPVWTRDGGDLLFIASPDGIRRIWESQNGRPPTLVEDLSDNITGFAVAEQSKRLAFVRDVNDTNIWRLDLTPGGSAQSYNRESVVSSSRMEQRPAVSPDGRRLAFESNRGGFTEIWMTDLQTGQTVPLTNLASSSGSGRWSHDGNWIVFDSRVNGLSRIFKVSATGGVPVPLTFGTNYSDILPVWSPDNFIYFCSDRSGEYRIWRISADGQNPMLVSANVATAPEISPDGSFLYYQAKDFFDSTLWRKTLRTGEEVAIAEGVCFRSFAVGRSGVYFLIRDGSGGLALRKRRPKGRIETLTRMAVSLVGGFSLSVDERWLYYAQLDHSGDELMLVNGFH